MRPTLALTRTELSRWKGLWWTGIALYAATWLAPFLPSAASVDPGEMRAATAMVILLVLAVLVPIVVGASLLSSELAEGRFGFFTSLPLGAARIWAAKLAAGAISTYGVLAIVSVPMIGYGGPLAFLDGYVGVAYLSESVWVLSLLFAPLAILLISHLFSVAHRDRSAWLAFDLAGLIATTWLVWTTIASLQQVGAEGELAVALAMILALVVAGLGLAGWRQVARGGVELRRSHAVGSTWGWGAMILAALAAFGWQVWAIRATPTDLGPAPWVVTSSGGEWAVVSGELRGRPTYRPSFLIDSETTEGASEGWLRTEPLSTLPRYAAAFSADGSTAAVPSSASTALEITVWRRDDDPFAVAVSSLTSRSRLALSDDGSMLAVVGPRRAEVYALPGGGLVGAARLDASGAELEPFFVGDRLRVVTFNDEGAWPVEETLRIAEIRLDPVGIDWTTPEEGVAIHRSFVRRRTADGERLLTASLSRESGATVRDGRTGQSLWRADEPGWTIIEAAFVGSGELVTLEVEWGEPDRPDDDRARRVRWRSAAGETLLTKRLDGRAPVLAGPIAPRTVRLLDRGDDGTIVLSLDLPTGSLTRHAAYPGALLPLWSHRLVVAPTSAVFTLRDRPADSGHAAGLVRLGSDGRSMTYLTGRLRGTSFDASSP